MASNDDLIQSVYAFFLNAYKQGASAADGGEVVAFEPIGFAPGCSSLTGTNVAAAALEEVSQITDVLPKIDGGVYQRTMRTISVTYGALLAAAQASDAASLTTFASLKSSAQEAYKLTLGSFDGPTTYLPTYPTPSDWYDLSNASNWSSFQYDSAAQVAAPPSVTPPAPVAPGVHVQWHILPEELREVRAVRPDAAEGISAHPIFFRSALMAPSVMRATAMSVSPHPSAAPPSTMARTMPASTNASATPASSSASTSARLVQTLSTASTLATQTAPQPVETPKFTISFDYCLVRLRRPWLSGDLLATPEWYVAGSPGGDYASGAPDNSGPFAVLPTAFIAVKNLTIDAAWTPEDAAAGSTAASFGPFSLMGAVPDGKNAMHNPGLQIIAWVCSPQPHLPPLPDPTLPAPAPAAAATPTAATSCTPTAATSGTPAAATTATPTAAATATPAAATMATPIAATPATSASSNGAQGVTST